MNIIEWAFGKRMTPQEKLRKNQRGIDKTIREIEREKKSLESKIPAVEKEMRNALERGDRPTAVIKAKDVHRRRAYIKRFDKTSTQLRAISLRIQTVRTNEQMAVSMKSASRIIAGMNKSMNMSQLSKIAQEFERENDVMEQRQEMMEDAVDDAMADEEEDEATEEVINQILDEAGINLKNKFIETPNGIQTGASSEARVAEAVGGGGDDDLQARLDSLRR